MRFADLVNFLRQTGTQIRETWQQLSASARVSLVCVGLLVAVPILYITFFRGSETRYITLTDNLTAQQISDTIAILDTRKVPYTLDESARTISVLPKDRSAMLLELERNDLPVGQSIPTGFEELFANPDFMSNQWANDIKFMRAVQGELENQLTMLRFVDYAKVFIREADNELFVDEQTPSEASVVLDVNRDVTPLEKKLLVSLVARAGGTNLHPNNITITTTDGEALHLPPDSPFAAIANDKLEFQDTVEGRIEKKIQDKLTKMGLRGTVTVGAAINFDEKQVTESLVSEGTPLSELDTKQDITTTERLPEGAPGALQNVPEAAAAPGGSETTDSMKETLVNHEPSRVTTTTKTDPGNVVEYKVALVVQGDDIQKTTDADGNETEDYIGLKANTRQLLEAIAQSAAASENANAEVQVFDYPFTMAGVTPVTAAIASREASEMRAQRQTWYVTIGLLVLIAFAFLTMKRLLNKSIIHPSDEKKEEEVREIPEATLEDMRRQEVAAEIAQLSLDDPDAVAALLRSWMSEEED